MLGVASESKGQEMIKPIKPAYVALSFSHTSALSFSKCYDLRLAAKNPMSDIATTTAIPKANHCVRGLLS